MTIVAAVLALCLVAASEASPPFPMIAFRCDGGPFLAKKLNLTHTHSHTWHDVPELNHEQEREKALCANDMKEILQVCRYNYPDIEVENIVESFHDEEIGDWCQHNFHGGQCDADPIRVRPYRCLTLDDMLPDDKIVVQPGDCQLKVIGDQNSTCLTFKALHESAVSNCTDLSLKLDSVHPLYKCGLGLFRSADYMCCAERRSGELQRDSIEAGAPRHEETDIAQRQNRNWTESNNSWFRSFYYPAHAEVDAVTIERFNWSLFAAALSLAVLLLLSLLALVWALFHFLGARTRARKMYCDAESETGERIAIVGGKRSANLNSYVL